MARCSILLLYILLFLFLPLRNSAADSTSYFSLARKADVMSSGNIMKIADSYFSVGKHGDALVLYAVVCSRFEDNMTDMEKNLCALAHQKAGKIYYERGDYVEALNEFINGVKVSERCTRPKYAACIYNYIGNVYCIFLDWEKGLDYYIKAYELCRQASDKKTEHDILVNMTGVYIFFNDMAKAWKYYKLSEQIKDSTDPEDVYMSGYMLSLIQICKGDVYSGVSRLKTLVRYAVNKKLNPKYQCFAYQEIYGAYDEMNMTDSTLKYMRLCDATAARYNLRHTFALTLKNLSEFYETRGDVVLSNRYKSHYLDIMDSIYDVRRFDAAKNSLFIYEVSKTTREISDLKAKEEQRVQTIRMQRTVMSAVVVVALVTAVFLFVMWRQKKCLRRSYADLYSVNRDFIATQEQLTARLRIANEALIAKEKELESVKLIHSDTRDAESRHAIRKPKYHTSGLVSEQAQALAEAIRNVMENTTVYCDVNFSLAMLAEIVNSNNKYVSQVINDTFHKSFNDYINPYRIHLACARFADTEHYGHLTMKAVAESVGFKSYSSFVSVFRKITGITPSLYRDMALNDKA